MVTASAGRCYSGHGHHKAAEEEDDPGAPGKFIWRKTCGRRASGAAGEIWRQQHMTELDEDKCGRWSTGSEKSGSWSTVEGEEQRAKAYQGSTLV